MKAIKYELNIIHKKEIVIGAGDKKSIRKALKTILETSRELDMSGDELVGIVVEQKEERDCPGACETCPYLCPQNEDCMLDDLEERCSSCEYHCSECGKCSMKDSGTCGEACEKCRWRCEKCGSCAHPQGEKLP